MPKSSNINSGIYLSVDTTEQCEYRGERRGDRERESRKQIRGNGGEIVNNEQQSTK